MHYSIIMKQLADAVEVYVNGGLVETLPEPTQAESYVNGMAAGLLMTNDESSEGFVVSVSISSSPPDVIE